MMLSTLVNVMLFYELLFMGILLFIYLDRILLRHHFPPWEFDSLYISIIDRVIIIIIWSWTSGN